MRKNEPTGTLERHNHLGFTLNARLLCSSEKTPKLAQKLRQLQPFMAVLPQECLGRLAYFGPS
jgi:hypothetical protein